MRCSGWRFYLGRGAWSSLYTCEFRWRNTNLTWKQAWEDE